MWSKKLDKYPRFSGYTSPTSTPATHVWGAKKIKTAEEYKTWLEAAPQQRDIVVYATVISSAYSVHVCQVVVNVHEDFNTVTWDRYTGYPNSHEIISVGSLLNQNNNHHYGGLYPHWRPYVDYKPVTAEQYKEILSVELQDNLARAVTAFIEKRTQVASSKR